MTTGREVTPPGTAIDRAKAVPAGDDRVPLGAWVIAGVFVALELAVSGRYGFQQDELYFLEAGHHLAFGYVDQPPLAPLLTRTTAIFGTNPTAIRIIPALAGGAAVVVAARMAVLFGAGRAGRVLAALVIASSPVLLGAAHIGNTTPYDCRLLTTFNPPDQVRSDWNDIQIGVCSGPSASWPALWPRLKHYD
jgi:hypothetical protein